MQDDPFGALEQAAQRSAREELAAKKIGKARVKLVLGKDARSVYFASLTLRLQPVVDWECDTAATDGRMEPRGLRTPRTHRDRSW